MLVVFIDWGFGYAGVRSTAENQADPEGLRKRGPSHPGGAAPPRRGLAADRVGALLLVPKMTQHPEFLAMAWVAAVASAVAPGWYFVGTEKMRLITLIQLGVRFLGAGLTFALVKGPDQAWVVMALFTASAVVGWIASDVMMYRRVRFERPRLRTSVRELRGATTIFMGMIAATLYSSFNVVLLGLVRINDGGGSLRGGRAHRPRVADRDGPDRARRAAAADRRCSRRASVIELGDC